MHAEQLKRPNGTNGTEAERPPRPAATAPGFTEKKITHPGHRGRAHNQTATKTLGPCGHLPRGRLSAGRKREADLGRTAPCLAESASLTAWPIPSTVDGASAFGAAREITDVLARVGRQPAGRLNGHRKDRRARSHLDAFTSGPLPDAASDGWAWDGHETR